MKVLHLSSERTWRGGEQQIAYLIEELETLGVQNFVMCRKDSAFEKYCIDKSIEHINVSFKGQFDFSTAFQLKSFCKYMNIDFIHAHSSHSHAQMMLSGMLGNKTKQILARRVDFPVSNNYFSKFKYNYSKIEAIVCVSDAIKEILKPVINKPSKLKVVYDGIDLNKFDQSESTILRTEFNLPLDCKIVANIAAIAPHKDYFTFVNTVEELVNNGIENTKFFIIGEGLSRKEIEDYISEKKLWNHIIMTGFRNDVFKIFNEIDCFLITSETEGLGSSVLDAFANKVPVVATAAGGMPEIVKNGQTGWLSPVKNHQDLAKNVMLILTNKNSINPIVQNAFEFVQNFGKHQIAKQTLDIYKSLLD